MKVLVIGAGAGSSTKDVENGVLEGLRVNGVHAARYALDHRLSASDGYLRWVHETMIQTEPDTPAPTDTEIQLHALQDVVARALAHEVDWVLVVSGMFVPLPFVNLLQLAGLPVAMLATESPYDEEHELRWAQYCDLVWTTERSSLPAFQRVQPRSGYLPHAWRPSVHTAQADAGDRDVPQHDVVFVGSCFDERLELLEAIDWSGIDLGLYGNWDRVPATSPIRPYIRESIIDNAQAAALYRRAKIGLNLFRESIGWSIGAPRIAHAESLNPRAYELAACGCFHLCQARAEVDERFGALVPTFRTAAECATLIRLWLRHDHRRSRVAAQLPATVAGDTWQHRGRQMAIDLRAALPAALRRVVRQATARLDAVAGVPA